MSLKQTSMFKRVRPYVVVASGVGLSMFLFQKWADRRKVDKAVMCECKPRLEGKVVVITGATSGIGYEVALQCAKRNATVIFGSRDFNRGQKVADELRAKSDNKNVTALHLDLNDLASCKTFAEQVTESVSEIAFLINNAGMFNQPTSLTNDGFDRTWQTNYLGSVVVTENLIDVLGVGVDGNKGVIFLSSEAKGLAKTEEVMDTNQMKTSPLLTTFDEHLKHYSLTKRALWMYATYLAFSQGNEVCYTVLSVDPSSVWTNIFRDSFRENWKGFFTRLQCSLFMRTPLEGAQTVMHCMQAPRLRNGALMKDCKNIENPCKTTIEHCPSFVANTHALVSKFIPNQLASDAKVADGSPGTRRSGSSSTSDKK